MGQQINDWTAVAQATVVESATYTKIASSPQILGIQAFLDTETAHTGTGFVVQISPVEGSDEDWYNLTRFTELIGTANSEAITNNPATVGTTVLTCASTLGYLVANLPLQWRAIKDATDANSEVIQQIAVTTNTNITILDGITNQHAQNTLMYSIAFSKPITIPAGLFRVRLVVNNNYDADGSTLYFKLRID